MKILRLNHGKDAHVDTLSDIKRCIKIFKKKGLIYYQNKEKAGEKEAVDNWNQPLKVFPKDTMAADLSVSTLFKKMVIQMKSMQNFKMTKSCEILQYSNSVRRLSGHS